MKNQFTSNLVFTIQLKLFDQIFDFNVLPHDDKYTLIHRLCLQNHIPTKYHDKIHQKVMNSFYKLLKNQSISQSLKSKVQMFLDKESSIYEQIKNDDEFEKLIIPQTIDLKDRHTCDKEQYLQRIIDIQENEKTKESIMDNLYFQDQKLPIYLQNNQNSNSNNTSKKSIQQRLQKLQIKQISNTFEDIQQLRNLNLMSNKNKSNKSIKKKLNQSEHILLKAYKNVYTKCKNSEMKGKTKQYIQQIKYRNINSTKPSQRRIYTEQKCDNEDLVSKKKYIEKQNYESYESKQKNISNLNHFFQFKHSSNRSSRHNLHTDKLCFPSTVNLNYEINENDHLLTHKNYIPQRLMPSNNILRLNNNGNNAEFNSNNKINNILKTQGNNTIINANKMIGKIQKQANQSNNNSQMKINTLNDDQLKYQKKYHQRINTIPNITTKDQGILSYLKDQKHKLTLVKNSTQTKSRPKSLYSITRKYKYLQQY